MTSTLTFRSVLPALLGLLLGLPILAQKPAAPPEQEAAKYIDVLFIGNSLTLANYPPLILQELSRAAKVEKKIRVQMLVPGSTTFQDHWEKTGAREAIKAHAWNYVVLQERSIYPKQQPELMMTYGKLLDGDIKKIGATTILYQTWPTRDAQQDQQVISDAYLALGKACHSLIAPAGEAVHAVLDEDPDFPLYEEDGNHESPEGAYLVACVFFATIYKQSPVGLPGKITVTVEGKPFVLSELPEENAKFLQEAAWTTVEKYKYYDPVK